MTPREIKTLVDQTIAAYNVIQHREWNGRRYSMSEMAMWGEASLIAPPEWREIIRVLAQGGDYYSIIWQA